MNYYSRKAIQNVRKDFVVKSKTVTANQSKNSYCYILATKNRVETYSAEFMCDKVLPCAIGHYVILQTHIYHLKQALNSMYCGDPNDDDLLIAAQTLSLQYSTIPAVVDVQCTRIVPRILFGFAI